MSSHRKRRKTRRRTAAEGGMILAGNGVGAKLLICGGLLAVSMAIKLLAPSAYGAISSYLSGSVDFRAAFSAVGEGISGEAPMSEALSEAYKYAFTAVRDDALTAADGAEDAAHAR